MEPPRHGPLAVRRLTKDDLQAVITLHFAAFPPELAFAPEVLAGLVTHPAVVAFGIDDEELGHVAHALTPAGTSPATLFTIAVHPRARGQGLADRLLEATEEVLRARRVREWRLHVHVDNVPARRLYERHGFTVRAEEPHTYPTLADPRGHLMVKDLR